MERLADIAGSYRAISLEEMGRVRLMNRMDTKFVASREQLRRLLCMAKDGYRMQQIGGRRNMPYYTCYFDTPDCTMFADHERGRSARQKVRLRVYEDSDAAFVEVKTKDNHGRTMKQRTPARQGCELDSYADFIARLTPFSASGLGRQLENHFHRMTLVNDDMTERLTIDTDLCYHNVTTGRDCSLDWLVIIELKHDGRAASPALSLMRDLHIHASGFSKYCVGMALTNDGLRRNSMKPRIRKIMRYKNSLLWNNL